MDLELRLFGRANGKTALMELKIQEQLDLGHQVLAVGPGGYRFLWPDDDGRFDQMESNRDDWDRQVHDADDH